MQVPGCSISTAVGVDHQVLSNGQNGHVALNRPGAAGAVSAVFGRENGASAAKSLGSGMEEKQWVKQDLLDFAVRVGISCG